MVDFSRISHLQGVSSLSDFSRTDKGIKGILRYEGKSYEVEYEPSEREQLSGDITEEKINNLFQESIENFIPILTHDKFQSSKAFDSRKVEDFPGLEQQVEAIINIFKGCFFEEKSIEEKSPFSHVSSSREGEVNSSLEEQSKQSPKELQKRPENAEEFTPEASSIEEQPGYSTKSERKEKIKENLKIEEKSRKGSIGPRFNKINYDQNDLRNNDLLKKSSTNLKKIRSWMRQRERELKAELSKLGKIIEEGDKLQEESKLIKEFLPEVDDACAISESEEFLKAKFVPPIEEENIKASRGELQKKILNLKNQIIKIKGRNSEESNVFLEGKLAHMKAQRRELLLREQSLFALQEFSKDIKTGPRGIQNSLKVFFASILQCRVNMLLNGSLDNKELDNVREKFSELPPDLLLKVSEGSVPQVLQMGKTLVKRGFLLRKDGIFSKKQNPINKILKGEKKIEEIRHEEVYQAYQGFAEEYNNFVKLSGDSTLLRENPEMKRDVQSKLENFKKRIGEVVGANDLLYATVAIAADSFKGEEALKLPHLSQVPDALLNESLKSERYLESLTERNESLLSENTSLECRLEEFFLGFINNLASSPHEVE